MAHAAICSRGARGRRALPPPPPPPARANAAATLSQVLNGVAVSSTTVARLFLTGFGTTALFGALVGGWVDSVGRKRGSLAFALLYALSALSTRCNTLGLLLAGRVAGGIGTSLLFSAPEAWLVSEHQRCEPPAAAPAAAPAASLALLAPTRPRPPHPPPRQVEV